MVTQSKQTWSHLLSSYTYDDIGMVPRKPSTISSRSNVDTSTKFLGIQLQLPLVVAPMSTLVDRTMAYMIYLEGCRVCLPRSCSNLYEPGVDKFNDPTWAIPSIGLSNGLNNELIHFWYGSMGCRHILVDVANGFNVNVYNFCNDLKTKYPDLKIIAGNVASEEGYEYLNRVTDAVRVGVGNGSCCRTSVATGVGLGQATAVRRIASAKQNLHIKPAEIIADGGIKTSGDLCKALALGADIVMTGSIFTKCKEAPMDIYAGEASSFVKSKAGYIEGEEFRIDKTNKSVVDVIKEYKEGLQSSMSYMGVSKIEYFKYLHDDNFVKLSNAAKAERSAHYALQFQS